MKRMFQLSYISFNVNVGQNFWRNAFITSASLFCCYQLYKLLKKKLVTMDMTKRCVLITGCNSGIERELAKHLDRSGCAVFAGCSTETDSKTLQEETSLLNAILLHPSSSESIHSAYEDVQRKLASGSVLWGVVNISGERVTSEQEVRSPTCDDVIHRDFLSAIEVVDNFLPLIKRSSGRIVNVAGYSHCVPTSHDAVYFTTKYAILGYFESLRLENKPWGISVSTIMSCFHESDLDEDTLVDLKQHKEGLPKQLKDTCEVDDPDSVKNSDLTPLVTAIEHALFSNKPLSVYNVGARRGRFSFFVEHLPIRIRKYFLN